MKHQGKAHMAAFKLIFLALAIVIGVVFVGLLAKYVGSFLVAISGTLAFLWVVFTVFTLYFFRDPTPNVPGGAGVVVSPAYATVDAIDDFVEKDFMGGECRRISMFLSVIDVHVQYLPVTGKVALVKHTDGQYLNAMRADSAQFNENVLIGLEATDPRGEKIGVRLIAGLIARRIIPWVTVGETPARGERMSLIQFGSRADVYLPKRANIKVKLGDKVVGGETILATFD
jgi:phosphatidylserine decarboxylase